MKYEERKFLIYFFHLKYLIFVLLLYCFIVLLCMQLYYKKIFKIHWKKLFFFSFLSKTRIHWLCLLQLHKNNFNAPPLSFVFFTFSLKTLLAIEGERERERELERSSEHVKLFSNIEETIKKKKKLQKKILNCNNNSNNYNNKQNIIKRNEKRFSITFLTNCNTL